MEHWVGVLVVFALHFSWSGNAALLSTPFCFCFVLQRPILVDIPFACFDLVSTASLVWLDANTLYT